MKNGDDTGPRLTEPVPTFASADEDAASILHVTPEAEAALSASLGERFLAKVKRRLDLRFVLLLALVLLIHAGIIAALLWRDAGAPEPLTQVAETPVEVVVEPPPLEPPPQPKPPEPPEPPKPPRPKEDLSPAMSAPRAPNEDDVKTKTKEAKTAAPNKLPTPSQGQPQAPAAAAPPPKDATTPSEKEEAAKEEDTSKPDAEALDKARKAAKTAKQTATKEAKAAPPKRRTIPNALAALAGAPNLDAAMSFAKPTPKTKIYGGTEDVRWMSEVEAMLEAKVEQLPHTEHYQAGGKVAICFHVDPTGRVIANDYCVKSGYPDIDKLAMRALFAAAPFPPPPPGLERGLIWVSTFDGQVPHLRFR